MNVRIALGSLFLALLGTAAYGADVYRSTAPDGTVSFSDRPQGDDAQFVTSTSPTTARPLAARTPGAANTAAANAAAAPQAASDPTPPAGPSSAALREQRTKNCEIARERLDRYNLSRRLFRTNAAGEREYLDDAAVADARAKAVADVQDWCD
jgi:septal ring-binding cell division protein DamX